MNSGVDDLLKTANYLKDKWFERPFSAIANEALALNLLMASPFNLGSTYTPLYVRNRIANTLGQIASKDDEAGMYSRELLESFKRKYPLASPNV
ncbi:MAG TPA: hypothetical protein VNN20_15165 [Thermodesulfobacteriota bacterium]|nr:hypothetical protein [Thermodesulfobacteriota bacterium]